MSKRKYCNPYSKWSDNDPKRSRFDSEDRRNSSYSWSRNSSSDFSLNNNEMKQAYEAGKQLAMTSLRVDASFCQVPSDNFLSKFDSGKSSLGSSYHSSDSTLKNFDSFKSFRSNEISKDFSSDTRLSSNYNDFSRNYQSSNRYNETADNSLGPRRSNEPTDRISYSQLSREYNEPENFEDFKGSIRYNERTDHNLESQSSSRYDKHTDQDLGSLFTRRLNETSYSIKDCQLPRRYDDLPSYSRDFEKTCGYNDRDERTLGSQLSQKFNDLPGYSRDFEKACGYNDRDERTLGSQLSQRYNDLPSYSRDSEKSYGYKDRDDRTLDSQISRIHDNLSGYASVPERSRGFNNPSDRISDSLSPRKYDAFSNYGRDLETAREYNDPTRGSTGSQKPVSNNESPDRTRSQSHANNNPEPYPKSQAVPEVVKCEDEEEKFSKSTPPILKPKGEDELKEETQDYMLYKPENRADFPSLRFMNVRKVLTICNADPNSNLPEKKTNMIKNVILNKILTPEGERVKPRFFGIQAKWGAFKMICGDMTTVGWIKSLVSELSAAVGTELAIVEEPERQKAFIAVGHFPNSEDDSNDIILKYLEIQNEGLNTNLWKVLDRNKDKKAAVRLTLIIDWESARKIKVKGPVLNYKLSSCKFLLKTRGGIKFEEEVGKYENDGEDNFFKEFSDADGDLSDPSFCETKFDKELIDYENKIERTVQKAKTALVDGLTSRERFLRNKGKNFRKKKKKKKKINEDTA